MHDNIEVFEAMAPFYIREDAHWGSDLDVLKDTFESRPKKGTRPIRYIDIGCGPGFHLAAMKQWYPDASVSGIDYSPRMLREAEKQFSRLQLDVKLTRANMLDFAVGTYDIVSCLNNTLGNVCAEGCPPADTRALAMLRMRKLLRKGGSLIVGVYNLKKLTRAYGRNIRIMHKSDLDHGNLFVKYKTPAGNQVEYYSHWFTERELVELVEVNGFKVEFLEKRTARLVVRARAV